MQNLRCLLLIIEGISGLKVNLSKSKMFQVMHVPNLSQLASLFGCQIEELHMLLLGSKFKACATWSPIMERVEKRLDSWKSFYPKEVSLLY